MAWGAESVRTWVFVDIMADCQGTGLNETTEAVTMLMIIVATMSKLTMDHRDRLRRRRCGDGLMTALYTLLTRLD